MSVYGGPEIANDGLVFAYDMGNTEKSWQGKPTTNLANVGLNGMSGVSLSFLGIEDGWKKYSMSGTFTGGTYPYTLNITNVSFTGGVTYSSSCFIRTNVENKFNYFGTGMNYVNVPMNKGGTSVGVRQADGSWYCGRSNFEYTSTTTQLGYILSNPINNTVFSSATDFVWIKNGQVELGEFSTPFAGDAGTRSNTQAVLDLTNNNTVTATSLTYASNGTFSFNGSNSLTVPYNPSLFTFNNEQTIIIWMKNEASVAARRNPYNQAYGGAGTITHENNTNFNYFYGTSGVNNVPYTAHGSPFSVIFNETAQIAITRNVSQTAWYKNGALGNTRANPYGATVVTGTSPLLIGTGYTTGVIGALYAVQIYNRALTAAEVQQNFVATRGRFGL
jgi:hypothetical protein